MDTPDVTDRPSRSLAALPTQGAGALLSQQLSTVNYLLVPQAEPRRSAPFQSFAANQEVWQAVLDDTIAHEADIQLDNFLLFDWFPRAPGLFHHSAGKLARSEARRFMERLNDGTVIFKPEGKLGMLHGGVGSIRLKPVELVREEHYLMTASSTSVAHEGFPIAVPRHLYREFRDELNTRGALPRTIAGTLRHIPRGFEPLFGPSIPQLYLCVEDIRRATSPRALTNLYVAVAVGFMSAFEGRLQAYAAYASFDPANRAQYAGAVNWMEHTYVESRYQGRIITDFDERESHFADAPFSLQRVMSLDVGGAATRLVITDLNVYGGGNLFAGVEKVRIERMTSNRTTTINASGNAIVYNADVIKDVVTTVTRQADSSAELPEVKALMTELATRFGQIAPAVDQQKARLMERDMKTLAEEMASAEPRREWYSVSLKGIRDAATAVGDIATPILSVVGKLAAALGIGLV